MPAIICNVRAFRALLKENLAGEDPIIVRNHRRVVAVVLPTGLPYYPNGEEQKAALSRMKIMLEQDVREAIR